MTYDGCCCLAWIGRLLDPGDAFSKARRRKKSLRTVEDKAEYDFMMQQAVTSEMMRILREEGHLGPRRKVSKSVIFRNAEKESADQDMDPHRWKRISSENVTMVSRSVGVGEYDSSVHFELPVTFAMADRLRQHYERFGGGARTLSEALILQMMRNFCDEYKQRHPEPVARLDPPPSGRVIVVGDTHGQLADVLLIFQLHGPPTKDNVYVFNGDIADRGPHACEIFFLVISYFLADPASIVINRGNHEDERMNRNSADDGGGFYDEVRYKYGPHMYDCFIEMFKVLSICTVIGDKVFVVHGGLSAQTFVTLSKINKIDHHSRPVPDTGEDLTGLQELWVDLLWSDPHDFDGCYANERGVGCLFGPDKTKEFLQSNGLKLIIRSHELPLDDTGFCKQRGNRCVTLFSASNYCGDTGNMAAVMVFDNPQDLASYRFSEYYAPSLELIAQLSGKGESADRWTEVGMEEFEKFNSGTGQDEAAWLKEVQKIMVALVENKPDIWSRFMEVAKGETLVNFSQWVNILSRILVNKWDWKRLWEHWKLGRDGDNMVNFVDFLRRFTVTLTREEYMSFTFSAISEVYHALLDKHAKMEEAFKQFDLDDDGQVDELEMREGLRNLDTKLCQAQLDVLVHSVFGATLKTIPVHSFFSRLSLVFRHAEDAISPGKSTETVRVMDEALGKIAQVVAATEISDLVKCICKSDTGSPIPPQMGRRSSVAAQGVARSTSTDGQMDRQSSRGGALKEEVADKFAVLFTFLDKDDSGDIDANEFVMGLWDVEGIRKIRLSNGEALSKEFMHTLARHLDYNNNGSISLWEFLSQFEVDMEDFDSTQAVVENIVSLLLRHRNSIRFGLQKFDRKSTGFISKQDFEKVLRALNKAIATTDHHWSHTQISDLCEALVSEDTTAASRQGSHPQDTRAQTILSNVIRYEEVFDSLQVVDSEFPEMGVRLGRDHKLASPGFLR
jgi:protein phosphatase